MIKFKGHGLTFDQFEEVFNVCKSHNNSPRDEVTDDEIESMMICVCSLLRAWLCSMLMVKVSFQ